jgi:hypothetical protein
MFSEENLLTLETIANHIAPIVKQLNEVENVRLNYIRDEAIEFVNILSEFVDNMRYSTESFYIILAMAKDKQLFRRQVVSDIKEQNKYTFSLDKNTLGMLTYTDEGKEQLCHLLNEAYTYEVLAIKDEDILVESILKQIEKIVFSKDV